MDVWSKEEFDELVKTVVPKELTELTIHEMYMTSEDWKFFFKKLLEFKNLQQLTIGENNFSYEKDFNYLDDFLKKSPSNLTLDMELGSVSGKQTNIFPSESCTKNLYSDLNALVIKPHKKMTSEEWTNHFENLPKYRHLQKLSIEQTSFDLKKQFYDLISYLAKNPSVVEVDLSKAYIQNWKQDILRSAPFAEELDKALESNTHLRLLKYGPFAKLFFQKDSDLSQEIKFFDSLVKSSIIESLEGDGKEEAITAYRSLKNLRVILSELDKQLNFARQEGGFKDTPKDTEVKKMYDYYSYQADLIDKFNKIKQQAQKTNPHDREILFRLANNNLRTWQKILNDPDKKERHLKLNIFFKAITESCIQATQKIKDRASKILIIKLLFIVTVILTLGLSLGIYAAVTKKTRDKKHASGFFSQNSKRNETAIDGVQQVADKTNGPCML